MKQYTPPAVEVKSGQNDIKVTIYRADDGPSPGLHARVELELANGEPLPPYDCLLSDVLTAQELTGLRAVGLKLRGLAYAEHGVVDV
jgi:hypothetical protein